MSVELRSRMVKGIAVCTKTNPPAQEVFDFAIVHVQGPMFMQRQRALLTDS
jgi:hypothetical protein